MMLSPMPIHAVSQHRQLLLLLDPTVSVIESSVLPRIRTRLSPGFLFVL